MLEVLLIKRCIKGDRAAQRALFDTYYKYVYTVCFRYVNHHEEAEDVVSGVYRRVFRHLNGVKNTADLEIGLQYNRSVVFGLGI